MKKVSILNCPYSRKKKKRFLKRLNIFLNKELSDIKYDLVINFNGQLKASRKTYYQGLIDLYDDTSKRVDISLNYFIEFDNTNNSEDCLWGIFHEMIHVKQIQTKELVIDPSGMFLHFQNKRYDKLKFRYKEFDRLMEQDRKLATQYHIKTIPWEKDPYAKSDQYTNITSH